PLHREPVFDLPEVELTIQAPPGLEPRVVEVSFPAGTSLADAKSYIYRELQELSVEATGPALRWHEDDGAVTLFLGTVTEAEALAVRLEVGVVEHLARRHEGPDGLVTARLTFARTAGWDRARAEAWAEERLGLRDSGRTALLARNYRAQPA